MKKDFRKKILKNGMTVLFEKRDVPVVSVAFAVRSGGINESEEEKGISHFIEHMLYKGTSSRNANQIAKEIEKKGGELNAFTDENVTAFWCKISSNYLDTALEVLTDVIKNPVFDKSEMEKERNVIFEEQKMRKDNPMIYVSDKTHECLYGGVFGKPLIGTEETMNSIDKEKITKKFRETYTSDNLILCVVGNANFKKIVEFAEKNFEKSKGNLKKQKPEIKNESKNEKRKGIDQTHLMFAHHVPSFGNKKCYAAEVLNVMMAGGMSSRLFEEIREKRNLAYAVKGESNIHKDFAYNEIYVGTTKESAEKVKKIIVDEFRKVSESLSEDELNEIKEQIIGNYDISMEDSHQQMGHLLFFETNAKAEDFYEFEDNIRKVKLKDVRELALKAVNEHSIVMLLPS